MRWSHGDVDFSTLTVKRSASILEALQVLESGGQSIAFVVDDADVVIGSLTDGDIRRALLRGRSLGEKGLGDVMCERFTSVTAATGRAEVLDLMRARDIGQLPVLDENGKLCGLHTIGGMLARARRPNIALVLAGGRGTRLKSLTDNIPKPMVKVAGRPILERLILHLMSHGIQTIYLSVNYLAHVIEKHFGDGSALGCEIHYVREPTALGTGGPIKLLDPIPSDPFLLVNGDLVTQCNVGELLDHHLANDFAATVAVKPYAMKIPFGVAQMENGLMMGIVEKPSHSFLVNAGLYVLSPELIEDVPENVEFPVTDLLQKAMADGKRVGGFEVHEDWVDVGRLADLRVARGEDPEPPIEVE